MTHRVPATVAIGAIAVLAVGVTSAVIAWRASSATIDAGFWWDDAPFALSRDDASKIGGPLSATELATIRTIARADVERAFADLRIRITDDREAFWRVTVVGTPAGSPTFKYPFAAAGESHVFAIGLACRDRGGNRPRHRPGSRPRIRPPGARPG